jgi:hypothetical protein
MGQQSEDERKVKKNVCTSFSEKNFKIAQNRLEKALLKYYCVNIGW